MDANNIGEFVSTVAMIKNMSKIQLQLKTAVFECRSCMRLHEVEMLTDGAYSEPSLCHECGGRSFRLLQEESIFINKRYAKLEEPLDMRIDGTTREIKAYIDGYLASPQHKIKPGDVVNVSGFFKIEKKNDKNNPGFDFIFQVHNILPVNFDYSDLQLSEEDIKSFEEFAETENVFSRFSESVAPDVYGYETIKEAVILQLFGPAYKQLDGELSLERDQIHILLIGDPGIGKSQILECVNDKAPKCIIINGASSTEAGVTSTAVKDEMTGAWTLEAGAIVLADSGILAIDEYDKLSKKIMKSMNEPMEQLRLSPAKAGIVQTMTARTSLLCSANPKSSSFNEYNSMKKDIDIPDSNLTRFDLIFALKDTIDETKDRELARSILRRNISKTESSHLLDKDFFMKYITYAKNKCFPILSEEVIKIIEDFFVETRQSVKYDNDSKPITPRDMKAIERLAIARARVDLRDEVIVDDALEAIRIYNISLASIGLSPVTAGERWGKKSEKELELIKITEDLIKTQQEMFGDKLQSDVWDKIKDDVKVEVIGTSYSADDIINSAFDNLRSGNND